MKVIIKWVLGVLFVLFSVPCLLLYLNQEKIIFHPQKLDSAYQFSFNQNFESKKIKTSDGTMLHGLLFKADNPKGLIFYLHGNAGSLSSWGKVATTYTLWNYDVFIIDYRGFGKSGGSISSQKQLFDDIQIAYEELKKSYAEKDIIILGYSVGTGLAAKLASTNHPKLLILQAPYYSLTDMMKNRFPFVPTFILKYKLETNQYLKECSMPVIIFHGDKDELIDYKSSFRLMEELKDQGELIMLGGQGHNGMTDNPEYQFEIGKILKEF